VSVIAAQENKNDFEFFLLKEWSSAQTAHFLVNYVSVKKFVPKKKQVGGRGK